MGIFDPSGSRMPGSPMFHRFSRIDLPGYQPVKSDRVENSAFNSATRTARHGRNRHNSGNYTFFSFEEGSNFVQNIHHYRTSFNLRRKSLLYPLNLLDDISGGCDEGIYSPSYKQRSTDYS